jgi:hypothetical protein
MSIYSSICAKYITKNMCQIYNPCYSIYKNIEEGCCKSMNNVIATSLKRYRKYAFHNCMSTLSEKYLYFDDSNCRIESRIVVGTFGFNFTVYSLAYRFHFAHF